MWRTSAKDQIPYLVSKWLHIQLLIDEEEMKRLLHYCSHPLLFSTKGVMKKGEHVISESLFYDTWKHYIDTLRNGEIPLDKLFRDCFTLAITHSEETLQAIVLKPNLRPIPSDQSTATNDSLRFTPQRGEFTLNRRSSRDSIVSSDCSERIGRKLGLKSDREIITPLLPTIQTQLHRFSYRREEKKIRPMVFGKDTISWGIQISYPQLYQDPKTGDIYRATDKDRFKNAHLFRCIQNFCRENTIPASFLIDGDVIVTSMRIGRNCVEWIDRHREVRLIIGK